MTSEDRQNSVQLKAAGLAGLLENHRHELRRFLVARCGNAEDADDLLQEMWLKIRGDRLGPVASGRAYLFRVANNLVLDLSRSRQRSMSRDRSWISQDGEGDSRQPKTDPQPSAHDMIVKQQEAWLLAQAIEGLPPGAARVLRLYRFEMLDQSEIARQLGINRSAVEKHLAVAMRHLRNTLADCGWYGPAASGESSAAERPAGEGG